MLFNFVFEGNLGADPEIRFTPGGKTLCKLRVGRNTRFFDRTKNEWVNGKTMWVTVTAWEALADRLVNLKKGDTVIVDAKDDLSVWAYLNQDDNKPGGQLQVTASNVSLSMRFKPAASAELVSAGAGGDNQWADSEEAPF